jgi:uncharacterized protein
MKNTCTTALIITILFAIMPNAFACNTVADCNVQGDFHRADKLYLERSYAPTQNSSSDSSYTPLPDIGATLSNIWQRSQSNAEPVRELTNNEKIARNEAAGDDGDAQSAAIAGDVYRIGWGGAPKDERLALKWYEKAAALGSVESQVEVGWAYWKGKTLEKNATTAAKWFEMAAKNGNAEAQSFLGALYGTGDGVTKDAVQSAQWHLKAAAGGNGNSQYIVGLLYHDGVGIAQDYAQAFKWFSAAAEQGHVAAQYNLGVMYAKGRGMDTDAKKAAIWYTKAAEGGEVNAQFSICTFYYFGLGVSIDDRMAEFWCKRAADQKDEEAKTLLVRIRAEAKEFGYRE